MTEKDLRIESSFADAIAIIGGRGAAGACPSALADIAAENWRSLGQAA
jgi:hypothetical protein